MSARKHITPGLLKAALRRNAGVYALAAAELGVSRQCVRQRVQSCPDLRAFVDDLGEHVLDLAEAAIINAIRRGDGPTCRWFLDRKGRSRGYGRGDHVDEAVIHRAVEALVQAVGGDVVKLRQAVALLEAA